MLIIVLMVIFIVTSITIVVILQKSFSRKKFERVLILIQAEKYSEALELLKALYSKNPNDRIYNWLMGQCYEKLGDYELALVEYGKVSLSTKLPDSIDMVMVHDKLARLNMKVGNVQRAWNEFQTVISFEPDNAAAYYYLGEISQKKREYQRAIEYFEKAVRFNNGLSQAYLELGKLNYLLNHADRAKKYLLQAITVQPSLTEAHYYYGLILERDRSYEKSIREFQEAMKDDRFRFDCYVHLGSIYIVLAQKELGFEFFEKALLLGTDDKERLLDAKYVYANYLIRDGDIKKALDLWTEIYSVEPHFKDVENKLRIYGELSKSQNLTRFITSRRHDFIETGKKICEKLNVKVESHTLLKEDLVEYLGSMHPGRDEISCVVYLAKWTTPVGEIPVRELLERMAEEGASRALFITSSEFSEKAYDLSKIRPLKLIEKKQLEAILSEIFL